MGLFYSLAKGEDPEIRHKIRKMKNSFRHAGREFRYADVNFMSVNVAKRRLEDLVQDYKISPPDAKNPTVVLFKGEGQVATARGFLSRADIVKLVNNYFAQDIKKIEKEK